MEEWKEQFFHQMCHVWIIYIRLDKSRSQTHFDFPSDFLYLFFIFTATDIFISIYNHSVAIYAYTHGWCKAMEK